MPFPEPLRPLVAQTDRPVGPEVTRDLETVESTASAGRSLCNQQLSYKLLITMGTDVYVKVFEQEEYALLRYRAAAIRRNNVRQQKIRDTLVGVDLIFHPREAVAFVFVDL